MKLEAVDQLKNRAKADLLILPFWQGEKKAEPAGEYKSFSSILNHPLKLGDFLGKEGQMQLLYADAKDKEPRILLLGLGAPHAPSIDKIRCSYAAALKKSLAGRFASLNFLLPEGVDRRAAIEGVLLAHYRYLKLKGISLEEDPVHYITKACFIGIKKEELHTLETLIAAVNFTRDLVNSNADTINPDALVKVAQELAQETGVKAHILRKKELEKENMGLFLAVSRGSTCPPALILLEYKGNPQSKEVTALVGKGVTFDTGGLNLKPTGSIETMKCDMAGAAAVLGAFRAAVDLQLKHNLIALVAATENAIGPDSYKPGDVYLSRSGRTVEISNTDAEGRLVLADALSYLQDLYKPTRIIDLATLTGGVVVALGEELTGLFSNDDLLAQELIESGLATHERLWRLPLISEYKELLKSHIADMKNAGNRSASSPSAAVFLQQFIHKLPGKKNAPKEGAKEVAWAHLDIAGTAYLTHPKGYHQTPATGVGVRLLVHFLQKLS